MNLSRAFRYCCQQPSTSMATLVTCAIAATASMAGAVTPLEQPPSVAIKYGDLDLSNEQGVLTLYRRITAAAQAVCQPLTASDLGAVTRSRVCQHEAIARAVRQVPSARLAAIYAALSSKS
jgi:UrcA family protein